MEKWLLVGVILLFTQLALAQNIAPSICEEERDSLQARVQFLEKQVNNLRNYIGEQQSNASREPAPSRDGTTTNSNNRPSPYSPRAQIAKAREGVRKQLAKKNNSSFAQRISLFGNQFDCYVVNLAYSHHDLKFFWNGRTKKGFDTFSDILHKYSSRRSEEIVFLTNAGMFTPDFKPRGLFIEERRKKAPLNVRQKGYGNFYLQPNGIFFIDTLQKVHIVPTRQYPSDAGNVRFATQSGPMLLINGNYNREFNKESKNLRIRSGVGIIDEHTVVFIISNNRVNFYNFSRLFKDVFDCKDALFLDGEVSQMYLPELGRMQKYGRFGAMIGLERKK